MNQFQVIESQHVKEALGKALEIPPERFEAIEKKLIESFKDSETGVEVLHKTSFIAESKQELAFIAFCIGAEIQRRKNPLHRIVNAILAEK